MSTVLAAQGHRGKTREIKLLFDVIGDRILVQKIGNRKDIYD